nr:MAG TPA: type I neck protein [Caudoviricetes sp.]
MAEKVFDFAEYSAFFSRLRQAASGDFRREIMLFLEGMGLEFLRVLEDEIIRREVVDSRLLLASFHKDGDGNVWEMDEGGLSLEVGTNIDYAAYVNDGHWTNEKGVDVRFVPGRWEGERFIYDPAEKGGMVLKQHWVEGSHYWESAIRIIEKMFPELIDAKLQEWLDKYFSNFV